MKLFEVFGEVKIDNKSANTALDGTESKGKSLGSSFGKLSTKSVALGASLATIAVAAVGAITKITKASIKAFDEQEKAEKRLESIAKTVTKATDEQIQSMMDLAAAYQEVTTFGDDVLIAGQSQLLSFGIAADGAEDLTESLANLLAATKGVDATQEDAINAANMLGKAYAGQVGALSRAGILLDDRQAQLLKTGRESQKVAVLTEIMNQNYGGLAQGLAETREGQMKQFSNALSDIGERFAAVLMPALGKFTEFLKGPVLNVLNNFVTWFEKYGPEIGKIVSDVFSTIFQVIEPVLYILKEALLPILGALFKFAFEELKLIVGYVKTAVNLIMEVLRPIIVVLTEVLGVFEGLFNFITKMFIKITEPITKVFDNINERLDSTKEGIQEIVEWFDILFNKAEEGVKASQQVLKDVYGLDYNVVAPFNFERNESVPLAPDFSNLEASVNNNFENGSIQVSIPVNELQEIQDINDFFNKIPQLRRTVNA